MDIGGILTRTWEIIWKNKVLWIFGIFAGCTSASGGNPGNFTWTMQEDSPLFAEGLSRTFQNVPALVWTLGAIAGFLIMLVVVALVIFLSTIGKIGVIKASHQAESGQEKFTFSQVFKDSTPYFWRVFLLNLLVGILVFIILFLLITLGVVGTIATLGIGMLCFIPVICLLVPIIWFVYIVVDQSSIAIVVEELGVIDGLSRGWNVVKSNLGYVIVMGLVLYIGIGMIGGFVISMPIGLIVMPAVFAAALESTGAGAGLALAGLCFVLYLPFYVALNGFLRGYIQSAWTLTFLELTDEGEELQPFTEAPV